MNSLYRRWAPESVHHLPKIFFWLLISLLVGLLTGLLSSLFLILLHEVTELRWHQKWLIYFLPLGGLGISFVYKKYGKSVEAGNKLLIQELQRPQKTIPFRMIPLVLFGTLTRHLFNRKIKSPYGRIFWGGSLVVTLSLLLGPDRYLGLGILP